MRLTVFATLAILPAAALAVTDTDTPPAPSETTQVCEEGLVWDRATETCLPPEQSTNDDSARLEDARELAYAERYAEALTVLETVQDREAPRVLTYLGFATRKSGDVEAGMAYYDAALAADPDLHLARAYRGMALIEAGDTAAARRELTEIRARGGAGGWPERALAEALYTGVTTRY
ncbi:hypothetical protein OG2516_17256 [Oceanicola granulosus HTCC2516]|uniref:Uncharacterized protein n=1 Tax=Oceanicola granulosus (strain ATCC BAA-861 / DSM 15982 / KCTC 12143 / HTCC2516) TaxID=314256 RepID=Q2CFJ2_OCEGH|nr:tetratricopeptide repeat protein [Oceanicola granulosus]EAR51490.1 hypothetical protein OG2516_17256 [Oceanicola granulosus HTCC2516]